MRALQFDAFGQTPYIANIDMPTADDFGVVIKVEATGLCRSDWHGWQGHDSDIQTLPHIPGHEFAGVVVEVGRVVKKVKVGDRVTVPFVCGCGSCALCRSGNAQVCAKQWQPGFNGPGSYAEYVAVPQADFNVVSIPDNVSFNTAASLGCRFATSYRGIVDVAKVQRGETVAVFGCGGVGLAAIMIAKSRGAEVIAIDISNDALQLAVALGADFMVNSKTQDTVPAIRKIQALGVDVTVDALGSIATSRDAVASLRIQGRHVQIGLLPPAVVGDHATVPMHTVIGRELQILGSHGMSAADYPRMLADIAEGRLQPDKLIMREISLDQAIIGLETMSTSSEAGVTIINP